VTRDRAGDRRRRARRRRDARLPTWHDLVGIRTDVERSKFFAPLKLWPFEPLGAVGRTPTPTFETVANGSGTTGYGAKRELAGRQGFEPRYRGPEFRVTNCTSYIY